jgi:alpha-L-fucosidase
MKKVIIFFLFLSVSLTNLSAQKVYLPTPESIGKRPVPEWFGNAKFGIFVHWGLYAVPAWANPVGEPFKVSWETWFKNNAYAEWYLNTMKFKDSPTWKHHVETYGENFDYYDFVPMFNKNTTAWNADKWTDLFSKIGAKYVVFTTKHHDGFTLYPSTVPNPFVDKSVINSPKDFVGELAKSSRKAGMKFGVYYSGGLDWTFYRSPIVNLFPDIFQSMPKSVAYTAYADNHYHELINRYKPDVLWNDINYPDNGDFLGICADAINQNPNVVFNDRWGKFKEYGQYSTPEYRVLDSVSVKKWETCRGIGYSFGYNQIENDKQLLSADALVDMLIDIVSKNGNFLLNVGPNANGEIPAIQIERLEALGEWLKLNGEGIFDTKPYTVAEGTSNQKIKIRFTQKENVTYTFLLEKPTDNNLIINRLKRGIKNVELISDKPVPLKWKQNNEELTVTFPEKTKDSFAYTLRVTY